METQVTEAVIYVAVGALGAVSLPLVLTTVGFGAAGIAGNSIAASMMSSAMVAHSGTIASGSMIAICQSAGVLGVPVAAKAAASVAFMGVTKLLMG